MEVTNLPTSTDRIRVLKAAIAAGYDIVDPERIARGIVDRAIDQAAWGVVAKRKIEKDGV